MLCDSGAATSLKQTSHYDELYCVFCLQQTGFFLVEYFTHTQERETRVDSKDENKSDKINKVKWRRDASRVRLTSSLSEKWAAVNFLLFLIVFAKKTVFSAVKQRLVLVFIKKKKERERERKENIHHEAGEHKPDTEKVLKFSFETEKPSREKASDPSDKSGAVWRSSWCRSSAVWATVNLKLSLVFLLWMWFHFHSFGQRFVSKQFWF